MNPHSDKRRPIVYACSGASSAAQLANHIAVRLDRLEVAEMSCIAGVGGDVRLLVRTAKSGRPIIALDGCALQCAAKILARHGLKADKHLDLSELGVKKLKHKDFDPQEAARVLQKVLDAPDFPGRSKLTAGPSTLPTLQTASAVHDDLVESASPPCELANFNPLQP
jgi:uncharacterized metal-binding protein